MRKQQIDIIENTIYRHGELLSILLLDRTRSTAKKNHNIIWATDSYERHNPTDEIQIEDITGNNVNVIQPRITKTKEEQKNRTSDKAEVFTPTNIVEEMNKQADWAMSHWPTSDNNWQDYVKEKRLEITCGEAPFIVNRYNAANGNKILKLSERVGFLDRKLQTVSTYCSDKKTWLEWAIIAFQNSYGYEWQGDNLLIARENLLLTFIDYWNDFFPSNIINLSKTIRDEEYEVLKQIATIISWNIFQMDGLKFVIPMSCKTENTPLQTTLPLFPCNNKKDKTNSCPGCQSANPYAHNGKYAQIMDWDSKKPIKFITLLKTSL